MSKIDELLKSFKEELEASAENKRDSSEEIIDNNIADWDSTTIDNKEPGSFEDQEITDAVNVTKNLENPLEKEKPSDDSAEEEHPEEEHPADCECPECQAKKAEEEKDESTLTEATMSDIPHEIDDGIHQLGYIRHELEQTEKNWVLSGLDVDPLEDILGGIDDLVAKMYDKGADLADQDLKAVEVVDKKDDEDKEEEPADVEDKKDEESEDKEEVKESRFDSMIREVLLETGVSLVKDATATLKEVNSPSVFDVRNAISQELQADGHQGNSINVDALSCGEDKYLCYKVTTNGQDVKLPKTIVVDGLTLEYDDDIYYVKD